MRPAVALQYLLPHRLLSGLVHRATRWRLRAWKNFLIRRIVKAYSVDLHEAATTDIEAFEHFNAFFTRELRAGARPQPEADDAIACPADGRVSQAGRIREGKVFQAKGIDYALSELLAMQEDACATFANGSFLTVYLSPRDYHRVHMPLPGRLVRTIHVPGRLFSVAPFTVDAVPGLFCRNERVVCVFEHAGHTWAQVLVGAMLVSSMETVWQGQITPPYGKTTVARDWAGIELPRGAEMGRFNMGSTVILILPEGLAELSDALQAGQPLQMGQTIGRLRQA